MEKNRSVRVTIFMLLISLACSFMILNPDLYSQVAPFNYVVEGNPEFRAELEHKIENILQSEGFDVKSVKITVESEERLYKKVVANLDIGLLEKNIEKIAQYIADIKKAISKEMPDIDIYRISFTLEIS